ncbi:uncharacterized protein C8R40DRAFT_522564 [Lentinula edodes]|uniref:uncharacterized protein n=1 Tax=Lentinula edodes TaxID=5353 RepID=UPI001E8E72A3|nr:uncharacterized protein C8R40DRAFT_522564 [Lentinula edodes]KAH7872051.1 hypothetical protein C8R40DRAFT_522564 [Lentinula edodes]
MSGARLASLATLRSVAANLTMEFPSLVGLSLPISCSFAESVPSPRRTTELKFTENDANPIRDFGKIAETVKVVVDVVEWSFGCFPDRSYFYTFNNFLKPFHLLLHQKYPGNDILPN